MTISGTHHLLPSGWTALYPCCGFNLGSWFCFKQFNSILISTRVFFERQFYTNLSLCSIADRIMLVSAIRIPDAGVNLLAATRIWTITLTGFRFEIAQCFEGPNPNSGHHDASFRDSDWQSLKHSVRALSIPFRFRWYKPSFTSGQTIEESMTHNPLPEIPG
jgi:hypothetical protein